MSARAALVSTAEPALTLLTEFVVNAHQNGRVIYAISVSKWCDLEKKKRIQLMPIDQLNSCVMKMANMKCTV